MADSQPYDRGERAYVAALAATPGRRASPPSPAEVERRAEETAAWRRVYALGASAVKELEHG